MATTSSAAATTTPISFQSKPRSRTAVFSLQKPLKLSFSRSFPSLAVSHGSSTLLRRRSGARMNASAPASYASALADVAVVSQTLEDTFADVEKIEKLFSDPSVKEFFCSPVISLEKKREVLDEIVLSASLTPHIANFLNILIDNKRIDLIKEILKEFELVYNRLTDTELAIVTSVVKLETQHLAQIAKQVQKMTGAKNVRIKTVIDPSLVAGFTVRYGNSGSKLIDMSVKKQLEEIAAQLDLSDLQLAV